MKLLCLFKHDWQELKSMSEEDIKLNICTKPDIISKRKFITSAVYVPFSKYYSEKICLRCGKYVDGIMPCLKKCSEKDKEKQIGKIEQKR